MSTASFPIIYADTKHYTGYRFECALRSSAILGFIGLPTLGFHLETAFREGIYSEAWALLYVFYILIASLRYWLKPRLVPLYIVASFVLLSRTITVSWENIVRFFTYDLLPWPMRRDGALDGTLRDLICVGTDRELGKRDFCPRGMGRDMEYSGANAGCVGRDGYICTAPVFPSPAGISQGRLPVGFPHYGLIVIRTTPEYILAYILVQLWGPSMLPAVWGDSPT